MLELLGLLLPVLREVDRPLHDHIHATGVPPFFSLSWYITWFAHNLVRLGDAARLFDLFLGSHPIMPIYAAAAVLVVSLSACPVQLNHRPVLHALSEHILQQVRSHGGWWACDITDALPIGAACSFIARNVSVAAHCTTMAPHSF